jgi:hypothetical protein
MPMTMDQLQQLVKGQNLKYFLHPENPALMLQAKGINGSYQFVIALQQEGTFLQFKTLQYLFCKEDNPNLFEALKVMGALNYQIRLAKWGWDPRDGEIDVCADTWIEDSALTQEQFGRITFNYLTALDMKRDSSLPPELQELLDKIGGAAEGEAEDEEEEGFATI